MSSFFSTTEKLQHVTPLPKGVEPSEAVKMLHGHTFFIQFNPHMMKYEAIDTPTDPEPSLPDGRGLSGIAPPECFRVTDKVHALPAGLWDSDVVSTYEFIDLEMGSFVRIRSPLNTVMETVWEVREAEDGSYQLVEDVVIKCSRLLAGIVKSTCDADWKPIHQKMMDKLQQDSSQP